ncbi:hypothetical protein CIPOMM221M3_19785 [Citrobacter portucalensis]
MVCVVGRMRDLILQLSKSSIYSTKPICGSIIASLFGGFYVTFCVIFALLIISLALSTTIRQPQRSVYTEAHA